MHLTHNVYINSMDMVDNLDEMQLTLSMVYAPCKTCMALAMKKSSLKCISCSHQNPDYGKCPCQNAPNPFSSC